MTWLVQISDDTNLCVLGYVYMTSFNPGWAQPGCHVNTALVILRACFWWDEVKSWFRQKKKKKKKKNNFTFMTADCLCSNNNSSQGNVLTTIIWVLCFLLCGVCCCSSHSVSSRHHDVTATCRHIWSGSAYHLCPLLGSDVAIHTGKGMLSIGYAPMQESICFENFA